MSDLNRRTVLRAAAWAAPAVVTATAAPAFATSLEPVCKPEGCKLPGKPQRKSYRLSPGCESGKVTGVFINGKTAVWDGRYWWLRDQKDSRSPLPVSIVFSGGTQWSGTVKFLPCKDC